MPGRALFYRFHFSFYKVSANILISLIFYFLLNADCGRFFFIIFLKILGMSNLFILIIIIVGSLWFLISVLKSGFINFILIFFGMSGKNGLIIILKLLIFFLRRQGLCFKLLKINVVILF